MLVRRSLLEMYNDYGIEESDVSLDENAKVVCCYEKECFDGGAYIGAKYDDGRYSVVGCGIDKFCTYNEMFDIVVKG